ncbi:MAG: DNA methyltransferase [Candidatus Nanohaloarchaea archaeon]
MTSKAATDSQELPEVLQSDLSIQSEPVTTVSPDKLRPHPRNKRVYGEDEELEESFVESVAENGVLEPLVVNRNHKIISGHRRWTAARRTGTEEVPVRVVEFDDELQEREALIEFNRQRDKTPGQIINEFDEMLAVERKRAKERKSHGETAPGKNAVGNISQSDSKSRARDKAAEKVDADVSGRTLEKGKKVKDIAEGNTEEDKPEKVKQTAEKEFQKLQKGETSISAAQREVKRTEKEQNRQKDAEQSPDIQGIVCGNAADELEELEDSSVDCIITDPPYGIDYKSNRSSSKSLNQKLAGDQDDAYQLLDDILMAAEPKLKDDAHCYIFCTWKTLPGMIQVVREHFDVKSLLNWEKNNHGMGDLHGSYAEIYEYIIFGTKGNRKLNYDTRPTNKFQAPRVVGDNQTHPTEKPVQLLRQLAKHSTIQGETILDPFCGTGSTLEAAEREDRDWFGVEINEEYVAKAEARMAEVKNQ